jgi:hypothetical protein
MRKTEAGGGSLMTDPSLSSIEALLWPQGFTRDVWMIVDGARDRRVYSALIGSYLEYTCLYAGDLPPALESAAPYLVQLDFEGSYTRSLLRQAWGNSWGVFLRCDESMERIRRHLRQFLRVQDSRGRYLVFRYYDPRVMRAYLPTCNNEELRTVFGPIKTFYVEDEDPDSVLDFRREAGRLATRKISLMGQEVE